MMESANGLPDYGLSETRWKRFEDVFEHAEREFNQTIEVFNKVDPRGDVTSFFKREAIRIPATKEAALEYLGTILFFFLKEYRLLKLSDAELLSRGDLALAGSRQITFECKWPESTPSSFDPHEREEQFDAALIEWLENREEWRKYEAQVLPEIALGPAPRVAQQEDPSPLLYFESWPLEDLTAAARARIKAELSEMHGAFLDNRLSDEVDCWRQTYDLLADEFNSAGFLSEDLVKTGIPEIIADAAAGAGWSREPFGRIEPTGVFSQHFGSQFYPFWRLSAFLESLQGRMTHWKGQRLGESRARRQVGRGPKKVRSALHNHRLQILHDVMKRKNCIGMEALARNIGISESELYGMARGDRTHYGEASLDEVLRKIGCSRTVWDEVPNKRID